MVAKLALCAVLFLSADGKDPKDPAAAAKPAMAKPAATASTQPRPVPTAVLQTRPLPRRPRSTRGPPPAKKKLELIAVERIIVERTNADGAPTDCRRWRSTRT